MKRNRISGFSLVEVALALGMVAFALTAVLGLVPIGLETSRAAINETRAAQIAQRLFTEFQSQSFTAVTLPLYDKDGNLKQNYTPFDLSTAAASSPDVVLRANNNGELFDAATGYFFDPPAKPVDTTPIYFVGLRFDNAAAGYDAGDPAKKYANKMTVRVSWDKQNQANVAGCRPFFSSDFSVAITRY